MKLSSIHVPAKKKEAPTMSHLSVSRTEDLADDARPSPDPRSGDHDPAGSPSRVPTLLRSIRANYALVVVWIVMAGFYAVVAPSFWSVSIAQSIFSSQAVLLTLGIASLCTFVVGEFDLSFAAVMGLSTTTVLVLSGLHGVNLGLACLVAVLVAVVCGALNALFVVVLDVPSLVVTLGSSSLFLGLAQFISSSSIVSIQNPEFSRFALQPVFGLPVSFYYTVVLAAAFAYVMAWTPLGRHMVFTGANREVARLAGINVNRIRAGSYIVGALIAGLAGVLLVATVGGFDPTSAPTFLLPALAAVFLGTAVVQPGQFNAMGTVVAIYFLATGIIGLQLLGYTGWVQDAFYGAGLVLAVTVATVVRARAHR